MLVVLILKQVYHQTRDKFRCALKVSHARRKKNRDVVSLTSFFFTKSKKKATSFNYLWLEGPLVISKFE